MTVNTLNITSGPYTGNGITTSFSYTFRVDDKTELTVFETTDTLGAIPVALTVDVDYTVNNVGTDGGGTIDRIAGALPTDYIWYIRSNRDSTQLIDFESQGGFFPDVHEAAIDKLTFLVQELLDLNTRTFRLSESDIDAGVANLELPAVADRANKILTFDVNGDLSVVDSIGTFRGDWLTATVYNTRDIYVDPATNNVYFVEQDHTSTSVAADLASGFTSLLIDAEYVKAQADAAAASAAAALVSENNAATSETNALASEVAAALSESNASASEIAALASELAALAVLADFETKYLGSFSTNPTVDNEGNPLIDGAIYYNNVTKELRFYDLATLLWGAVPINAVLKTSDTGSAVLPVGTTAERDVTPFTGYFRYNNDLSAFEGYNGSSWGSVGGGATGGGADEVFVENDQVVTTDYTIPVGRNAMSTGDITINTGVTVTVSTGSNWVVI